MHTNTIMISSPQEWHNLVLKSEKPVVAGFYADWCHPCKKLNPLLIEAAKNNNGKWLLALLNVDIDDVQPISREMANSRIPSVCLISEGTKKDSFIGFSEQKTRTFLAKVNAY